MFFDPVGVISGLPVSREITVAFPLSEKGQPPQT
jgi:hypothetical protein